jgi:hypothetical protein
MCIHYLGHFSPLPLDPSTYLPTDCFQAEHVLPFLQFYSRQDIGNNKKDKAFLLVEIRIAIQRDS